MFSGLLFINIYTNQKLKAFFETQSKTNNLLRNWDKAENSVKELFMTYDLKGTREKWNIINDQFEDNLQEFLKSPVTLEVVRKDVDIELAAALLKMHWRVTRERLRAADKRLETYLSDNKKSHNTGNLLVTFGSNLETGNHSKQLVDLIESLRLCTSLSDYIFTDILNKMSKTIMTSIQKRARRLRLNSILLSLLIFGIASFFFLYRMKEITQSRETLENYARNLSIEVEERKNTEKMLSTERDKLHVVLNAMGDGMYIVNKDFIVEYQNEILKKSYENPMVQKCFENYMQSDHPCDYCLQKKVLHPRRFIKPRLY